VARASAGVAGEVSAEGIPAGRNSPAELAAVPHAASGNASAAIPTAMWIRLFRLSIGQEVTELRAVGGGHWR
jgi:hypothetical protein